MGRNTAVRVIALTTFAAICFLGSCSGIRTNSPVSPPLQTSFPQVTPQTGDLVAAEAGATTAAAGVSDAASGAAVTVPAGTRVHTADPEYDSNADGWAESFAPGVAPLGAAQRATAAGSPDGGQTFHDVIFCGGATFAPTDAWFDPPVQIVIPLAPDAPVTTGMALDVWRFAEQHAASQTGGGYWALMGRAAARTEGGHQVVRFPTQHFGTYAASLPTENDGAPTVTAISAVPVSVAPEEETSLVCQASDPDGDALTYAWSGPGNFTENASSATGWSADQPGAYQLECTVGDGHGHLVSALYFIDVSEPPANLAPQITALSASPATVVAGGETTLTCEATDPEGDELSYAWTGTGTFGSPAASTSSWSYDTAGAYDLTCTVSDTHGNEASQSVSVTVTAGNGPPVITALTATPATVEMGMSTDLECVAEDPDADTLSYEWSGEGSFVDPAQAQTAWSHDTAGVYTLTCVVDDGQGGQDSSSLEVTVLADTAAPDWPGGDAGLSAAAREGYVLLDFAAATDALSAPVSYTVYYDETATFDQATATPVALDSYPAMPLRIDGLDLGTEYTFGLVATDSATDPNSTALVTVTATPRPYYDGIPAGGRDFAVDVKSADVAAAAGSERALTVVWADPLSGTLRQSYYTDGAWVTRDISAQRTYVIPQVFFVDQLPSVVAADDAGSVELLQQGIDGQWTATELFQRSGVTHVAMDALYDPATGTLYVGHVTEDAGPPVSQTVHFLVVDLSGAVPAVADQLDDQATAPFIGQVKVRLDSGGQPVMIYSFGEGSFAFPNWLDTELAFAHYDPALGFTTEAVSEFNPLFFDVRAAASGWELAVTDGELTVLGDNDFIYLKQRLATGAGDSWTTTDVYTEDLTLTDNVITYDAPLECALAPAAGALYYTRGAGEIDLDLLETTATLSLWTAQPPGGSTEVLPPIARLVPFSTGTAGFLLGAEVAGFEFQAVTNQLSLPGGNLLLRELP